MSDQFVAEIRLVPFNFAPVGWAMCQGQLLPISQNTALFSLLGTNYGGDGRSTFGLPNLQGMAAMHTTQYGGSSLGQFFIGQTGGGASVTLSAAQMALHTHTLMATGATGSLASPAAATVLGATGRGRPSLYASAGAGVATSLGATSVSGGGLPHNNLMPYLVLNYIIALQGIYPPRS